MGEKMGIHLEPEDDPLAPIGPDHPAPAPAEPREPVQEPPAPTYGDDGELASDVLPKAPTDVSRDRLLDEKLKDKASR